MNDVAAPLVEVRGVRVVRDGRCVVDAVDMDVQRGSIHALIGPNGAGKSTLVAAMLGHLEFSGEILIRARRSGAVGYVPQAFPVDRTLPMTVAEFLALPRQRMPICLGVSKKLRASIETLLERVDLGGFGARRLGGLSGGELQRVVFANALDPEPEVLMLDEPSASLDHKSLGLLEDALDGLRARGVGMVLVSHDPLQVRRIADRVTWIEREVKATGSVSDVFGEHEHFPFAPIAVRRRA